METFEIKYENQVLGKKEIITKYVYCSKQGLVKNITIYEWNHLISIKILNKGDDKVNHREITKEELERYI